MAQALKKANKALNAVKLLPKFFNAKELMQITTNNFYTLLYNSSEKWLLIASNQTININFM
jgi:hypothetical protein